MYDILTALLASTVLGLAHLLITAAATTKVRGAKWNMSSRDQTSGSLPEKPARLVRSFENFKETFPFFVAACALALHRDVGLSDMGVLFAWVYFAARLVYIPCYVLNIVGVRSLVWLVSLIGIVGVMAQAI